MASGPDEEEIRLEVVAVQAVYGDDCRVIQEFPPHLTVHIRPRTADDSSRQFVEVILGIESYIQYPRTPPYVYTVETKGLDEKRQAHLITGVQNKAKELSSGPMLIALCEEAVEILSNMNHPDGDCPLCLYPLISEDIKGYSLPFMKLMSCYHCFHSECIIRWWNWLLLQKDATITEETAVANLESQRDVNAGIDQRKGSCPVCRMVFDVKDIEHVADYLRVDSSEMNLVGTEKNEDENVVLQSESEISRRQQFEALLKLQQEKDGIIEPKKDLSILPGMFPPEPTRLPTESVGTSSEISEDNDNYPTKETESNSSMTKAAGSKKNNMGSRRKSRIHGSRNQPHGQPSRKQWRKKGLDTSEL